MNSDSGNTCVAWMPAAAKVVPSRLHEALFEVRQNHYYAMDLNQDAWQFATSIQRLRSLGVSENDIRWMIGKEWLLHAYEEAAPNLGGALNSDVRRFRRTEVHAITEQSAFVLTPLGVAAVDKVEGKSWQSANASATVGHELNGAGPVKHDRMDCDFMKPYWDADVNQLYLGNLIVKTFRLPSPNQTKILSVFQEEGWPVRIDDPLPPSEVDPKYRLRYTIKSLNKHQRVKAVHFAGDGTGQGVLWQTSLMFADAPPDLS